MAGSDDCTAVEHMSAGEGRYRVHALAYAMGDDLVVSIYGGDRPHAGAVGLSVPRPSLRDPERTSATTSVLTLPGHKEDLVVKEVGEYLASTLQRNVVVVAGVHFDSIDEEGIRVVVQLTRELAGQVVARFARSG